MSREPKRLGVLGTVITVLVILAIIAATGFVAWLCIDMANQVPENLQSTDQSVVLPTEAADPTEEMPEETTVPPTTTEPPEPETVIATATISAQGDLLMHSPVFNSARQSDGSYNFESVFRYGVDLVSSMDYAVANLETTFGGPNHPHVPNQSFSCPDALAQNAKDAGYDMFLTANNHSGDTTGEGVIRTLEVSREAGLATLGSQMPGEKRYSIVEVNGIKIGMVAYTWAFKDNGGSFSLNGLNPIKDEGQMNFFTKVNPDKLYKEVEPMMAEMKAEGAEATMIFIHWGEEYQTTENAAQQKVAQRLCDIGFDVIVGGHAHVVQPMALLESTVDPDHKTVCIYSLGNAVSNQRTGVSSLFPAGYTEDGAMLTVTFEKYSDGKVYLANTDVIPTWVNMHSNKGAREYNILPLVKDNEEQWQESYELTDHQFESCKKSYVRTMGIVGDGLLVCQTYLDQAKIDREQYYYDLAFNPEKLDVEVTETSMDVSNWSSFEEVITAKENAVSYSKYDLNADGEEELILKSGTCEADYMYSFFANRDGIVIPIGEAGGSHSLLAADEDGYLIIAHGQMGYERAYRITWLDEMIDTVKVYERDTGTDGYTQWPVTISTVII